MHITENGHTVEYIQLISE